MHELEASRHGSVTNPTVQGGETDLQFGRAQTLQQVQSEVERLQVECLAVGGGCATLRALHLCLLHGLSAPTWLAQEFSLRFLRVTDAHVGSWDEAFGRPWPKHTRLHVVRERRQLLRLVHSAVWEMACTPGPRGHWAPINRIMFDQIGERPNIAASGSKVERMYYEALRQGFPNVAELRAADLSSDPHRLHEH